MKFLSFLLLGLLLTQTAQARKTCSQFKTYAEAKSYLDAKKLGYKSLDKNHNGIPCESLYKTTFKKSQVKTRIRIYKYGEPHAYGQRFTTMDKCMKEQRKLTKSHKDSNYTYKCEEI